MTMKSKTARVFRNGRSLAVRIPKAWIVGTEEVTMRKEGDVIMIRPKRKTLGELADEFGREPLDLERLRQSVTPPKSFQR